jgi:hypothetical protein
MQAGPGGFGPGPEDSPPPVAVRIIAAGRFTGPVSWRRAK